MQTRKQCAVAMQDVEKMRCSEKIATRLLCWHSADVRPLVGPVPARYVRQSQLCPQLDVSDKNVKKTQDMSDRARYVLQKM